MEQFAQHHGDLGGVNAVGAEHGAAPAFSALVGVHEPFLEHANGHLATTGELAQDLAGQGEVLAVHRPQQLCPQNRHVLGIAGAKEEVALVGAGAATDAAIHEDLQRPETLQPVCKPLENDLLPVLRQFPVVVLRVPFACIGKTDAFLTVQIPLNFRFCCIGIIPGLENDRNIHPILGWNGAGHQRRAFDHAPCQLIHLNHCCHCSILLPLYYPALVIGLRR